MFIGNVEVAVSWLETVGYYRLSAYWLPFEEIPNSGAVRSKQFKRGTSFHDVTELYMFDRRLRVLILEAIERIEVHARARWTYHLAHKFGSHAHLKYELFNPGLVYSEQLVRLARSTRDSKETFILHYNAKYTEPHSPPLWAVTELMTLGELSKWVQATRDNQVKSRIARDLGLPTNQVLESTLQLLAYVRNICAHHGRLWNRRTVLRLPRIKNLSNSSAQLENATGSRENDNRIYNILVVLLHLLSRQSTDSSFPSRLHSLVSEQGAAVQDAMGFPVGWRDLPVWR
jgi:abortive infection bacteriophage resistance protein